MTQTEENIENEIPDATQADSTRSFSTVWIIPIIAALLGGWLVLKNFTQENVLVEVSFESAAGLEAGKTQVKFRNIKIGQVTEIRLSPELTSVIATIEFVKSVKQEKVTDQARFWVVRPRIAAAGVSGLDTLLSGAYIEIDPSTEGQPAAHFTGLENPQLYQLEKGTKYSLTTDNLGSLSVGIPIKYRGIQVGMVTHYDLAADQQHVDVEIFVREPHDQLINSTTRFWDISGISVEVSARGVELNMDSVASLLSGGIAFSSDENSDLAQAEAHTVFQLFRTERPLVEEIITYSVPLKLYFENGVTGLTAGAPVEYKGLRIGTVKDIGVESDEKTQDLSVFAMIGIEPDRLPLRDDFPDLSADEQIQRVYQFFDRMASKGMRAQLKVGELLTGKSLIALDFFPDLKSGKLKRIAGDMIMPTAPETLETLVNSAKAIARKLSSLPMQQIGSNMEKATASLNTLLTSLNESLPMDKIGANLTEATANLNKVLKSYNAEEDGMMGLEIRKALKEYTRAAQSIRAITDYLERHPESLLKGKSPE